MKAAKSSLSRKITLMCLLMAVVICVGVCVSGYFQYRNSTYQTYNSFAYNIGETALAYVDGARIAEYLVSGEPDAAYHAMAKQIFTLYAHNSLTSIYLCVPDPETLTVATIYDTRVHEAENPAAYALGVIDPIGASDPQQVVDIYRTGKRSADYFIRRTRFGFNTSAILPVAAPDGRVTALLLVDVPMPFIRSNLTAYLLTTIGITAVLVFLLMSAYMLYLRRGVVAPIRAITQSADDFVQNRASFSKDMARLKTGDEIETLANALAKMEVDITSYIESLAKVTADKERIATELHVATQIQTSMLPSIFPPFPQHHEFSLYATMNPAKEVGGDFYDFFMTDDAHVVLVIADVSGKGVPAALFMVIAKTLIKNSAQTGASPKVILETVNNQLCENNEAGMFVTVWLGILDIKSGEMVCANAGHEYPAIMRRGGDFELLKDDVHGVALACMEDMPYSEYAVALRAGDTLYVYTDGVPEATNGNNQLFETERMLASLNRHKREPIGDMLVSVRADVDAFVAEAPQFDDVTMLAIVINDSEA